MLVNHLTCQTCPFHSRNSLSQSWPCAVPNSAAVPPTPPHRQSCPASTPSSHHPFPAIPVLCAHLESRCEYTFGQHFKRPHLLQLQTATFETLRWSGLYFMYKKKEILAFQTFGKKNLEQKCSVFFFIY